MKKSVSIVLLGIAVAVVASVAPVITWKSTNLELGKIEKNVTKQLSFEFTNTGDEPVRILEAKGSCGCTVVDFSKDEIGAGETATITADFKSSKVGVFKKSVKVKTTASVESIQLWFSGEVIE